MSQPPFHSPQPVSQPPVAPPQPPPPSAHAAPPAQWISDPSANWHGVRKGLGLYFWAALLFYLGGSMFLGFVMMIAVFAGKPIAVVLTAIVYGVFAVLAFVAHKSSRHLPVSSNLKGPHKLAFICFLLANLAMIGSVAVSDTESIRELMGGEAFLSPEAYIGDGEGPPPMADHMLGNVEEGSIEEMFPGMFDIPNLSVTGGATLLYWISLIGLTVFLRRLGEGFANPKLASQSKTVQKLMVISMIVGGLIFAAWIGVAAWLFTTSLEELFQWFFLFILFAVAGGLAGIFMLVAWIWFLVLLFQGRKTIESYLAYVYHQGYAQPPQPQSPQPHAGAGPPPSPPAY